MFAALFQSSTIAKGPFQSIQDFRKGIDELLEVLQKGKVYEEKASSSSQQTAKTLLQNIADFLIGEDCEITENLNMGAGMEAFLEQEVLSKLCLLTSPSQATTLGISPSEQQVIREFRDCLLHMTATLVGTLSTTFLFNSQVHQPINQLLQEEGELKRQKVVSMEFVLLEYQLALKLLESQELLHLFFSPCADEKEKTNKPKFPIFDHLLRLLHLEGEEGEYARAAFEALAKQTPSDSPLESYLLSTDFASILMASLAGLFAQLPDILPNLSKTASRKRRQRQYFEDMKRFKDLYIFCHNCLVNSSSEKIRHELQRQFSQFLMGQVLLSSLLACSDLDGSSLTCLFYIQEMIELTSDAELLQVLASFLLNPLSLNVVEEDEVSEMSDLQLCPREIILSKLNSLSEPVVTMVLQMLSSLLSKCSPSFILPLLFTSLEPLFSSSSNAFCKMNKECFALVDVSDYLGFVPKPAAASSTTSSFDAYLADAISSIAITPSSSSASINDVALVSSCLKEEELLTVEELQQQILVFKQDPTFTKLFAKLDSFFSQSLKINIALSGVFTLLATLTHGPAFITMGLLSKSESPSLYGAFTKLKDQVEAYRLTVPSYDVRLLMARQKVIGSTKGEDQSDDEREEDQIVDDINEYNVESEMVKNIVIMEEFAKEIASVVVMKIGNRL